MTTLHSSEQKKFLWLEAMRAVAALWVLLHHAVQAASSVTADTGLVYLVLANGFLGVNLFFILSGFIIAMSCERLLAAGLGLKDYLRARLLRIYLPYLPVGIAMLALYSLFPDLRSNPQEVSGFLASLTLMPSDLPPALSVAWTLVHELIFYALFCTIFVSRRLLLWVIALWMVAMGLVWHFQLDLPRAASYLLSPINLCFLLGVAAFYLHRHGVRHGLSLAALAAGLIAVGSQAALAEPLTSIASIGFVLLILAAVSPELARFAPRGPMIALGAASYSIYLIHKPVLAAAARVIDAMGLALAAPALMLALSLPALLAGLLYFYIYEQRALRYVRRRASSVPEQTAWAGPASSIDQDKGLNQTTRGPL